MSEFSANINWQRQGDDFRAYVVAVKTRLGDEDAFSF